ncbi:ankyrin repeat domain-containing protein [Wolbachia endosymbiont (group B) of Cyclophora punctaria]|uniref:ankyrin repeat domain-containing protein n=1 Tax=Wolbachia endosymbiont (group B) of Cyclophora punctaria TaxID=3066168 RepID=UPI00333EFC13
MTGEYKSLKKVLSTIEVKEGLDKYNIIKKIQEELKEQNLFLYLLWEIGSFDVNYVFSLSFCIECMLLKIAAKNGYTNIVNVLLEKGADVNERYHSGNTVLHLAAENGHEKTVEFLLAKGANVNEKGYHDMTPLHFAACNGHEKTVEVLIKAGADVNAADQYGETPLDYAVSQNVVTVLLNEVGGSFVKARNKAMIAGGVNTLLGTAIAVALFTTGTIAAQLIPIVIAVVAVTAAALVVGCATYELLKPSTKVDGAEKPIVNLTNEQQGVTVISS